ncbi:MAG TPA: cupin domain-containing protein [Gemmatimonadaceae bacterium]|nr:cupin domain-containing protein [Gemmatimonadaceae bacterium]
MRYLLVAIGLSLVSTVAESQSKPGAEQHAVIALPGKITWAPAPPILPRGADLAVVEGDPSVAAAFTMRLRMPDGYKIPAHFHPFVEHVTVIQGTFRVGMGDKFDATTLADLPVGTFAALAPGVRHFAQAKGETVIQLHGIGPWSLTYVNSADDPRKQGQ